MASPIIVATASLTGKTAEISTTTLYTPDGAHTYRLSVYLECASGANNTLIDFQWVDDFENASLGVTCSTASHGQATHVVRSVAGQPITYFTTDLGSGSGLNYNAFVVLERLA